MGVFAVAAVPPPVRSIYLTLFLPILIWIITTGVSYWAQKRTNPDVRLFDSTARKILAVVAFTYVCAVWASTMLYSSDVEQEQFLNAGSYLGIAVASATLKFLFDATSAESKITRNLPRAIVSATMVSIVVFITEQGSTVSWSIALALLQSGFSGDTIASRLQPWSSDELIKKLNLQKTAS